MAITPKQAAEFRATTEAQASESKRQIDVLVTSMCENLINVILQQDARVDVGATVRTMPPLLDFCRRSITPDILLDLESRFKTAGWNARIEGDVLKIDPPTDPPTD